MKITRKKLTKEFASLYVRSLPNWKLLELCEKFLKKRLNKLSEKDFVEKLMDKTFGGQGGVYSVGQWDLFDKYMKQKNK